jgi:hypothetical protein
MATAIDAATKPPLRTRRARGPPSRPEQASSLHFGFIASVSIIGLACKPRSAFQLCEIMGVRLPAKAWSKASAAWPRKASTDLKDVPWRQPARDNPGCHGGRSTSNVKGRLVCQGTNCRGAQRRQAGYSICCAGTVPHLAHAAPRLLMRWLGPRASSNNPPRTGIAPALRGRPHFAASPSSCDSPGRLELRRWAGAATCAAARSKIHETQKCTRTSWIRMVATSKPLTMVTV